MKNVLISGASGIVGYGILRCLKKSNRKLNLIGTSIYDDSVAPGFCDIFEQAPQTSDPSYMPWLLDMITKHEIDMIIPGIETDVHKWVEHIPQIEKAGALPLLNNGALINLCKDKWAFYETLRKAGMSCVIPSSLGGSYDFLAEKFGVPFLLKPRCGFGSKGIVRVDCLETFLRHSKDLGETLMAQPIVGDDGEEYTTTAFCDGQGSYFASMTLRRKLSKDGFTEKAEVFSTDNFFAVMNELCETFHPIGPTNFQFRKCKDGVKLLEINPRISSSTSIRAAFGYNESLMAVNFFLQNQKPIQPQLLRGKAVRYIEEYIFYENCVHL